MRIVIAGGHGKIARHLTRQASARGYDVVGLVRNPDHVADLEADGGSAAVLDLESASSGEVAAVLRGADAVVFAAGAGPGSSVERKDTVDRAAAVLLADGAEAAGVRPYLLVSSIRVDSVRDGATPEGMDDVFVAYLRAKLAAEQDVLARRSLDAVVLRPAALTDDDATGRVHLAPSVDRGRIPRADVAAVALGLLERVADGTLRRGTVLGLDGGDTPVDEAVSAVCG